MSIVIEIDGIDSVEASLDVDITAIDNPAEGLLQSAEATVLRDTIDSSMEVWEVRTGNYSANWYSDAIDQKTIEIGNAIDYAAPLEFGWTLRGGNGFFPSPGVLVPAVMNGLDDLVGAFQDWLTTQLQQGG